MNFIDRLDPSMIIALVAGVAVVFLVEAIYLVFFARSSYRSSINRRLSLSKGEDSREKILIALRRERGLTGEGHYLLPFVNFNKLILQSGLTLGVPKLIALFGALAV